MSESVLSISSAFSCIPFERLRGSLPPPPSPPSFVGLGGQGDVHAVLLLSITGSLMHHYRWDMLTSDLELVESIDANYDVVYGIYDPKYFTW